MPLHKRVIVESGPLGDNFYADELLPRLLKLQNGNRGDSYLFNLCQKLFLYVLT